jgi:hypothetical protein
MDYGNLFGLTGVWDEKMTIGFWEDETSEGGLYYVF